MSIGSSGRIVIEVDPEMKRHLYAELTRDGMSLKEWFLNNAQTYLKNADLQPPSLPENMTSDPRDSLACSETEQDNQE